MNGRRNGGQTKDYTVGSVLIAWFNYCVLSFASENANLLIAFASHEAHEVRYEIGYNCISDNYEHNRNSQFAINRFSQLKPVLP